MQDLDDELLGALISVQHLAGQKAWPFFIIGAGLPNLPGKLSATRTYSERLFDYRTIGALDHASAADAISLPMNRLGAHLETDALRALVTAADGHPFFLQAYGKAVWDVSSSKTHDEASSTAQVASRLSRAANQLTVARSSLISKGLI
ncbi:hypothetical protein [Arthrobacter sp. ISL-72]|uniref:hypothetical protein n=1 Tax=Arthrobacter sp. ISL-72 TaxID=2819114 RepID=UPI002035419F|nr:hypothetical protein [Arthrobacter sp. ISL-72]